MSRPIDVETQKRSETIQVVVFQLGRELYAISIGDVQEIVRMQPITPVPGAPGHVEGIVNLRGQVIPVINLSRRLGFVAEPVTPATRIVVAQAGCDTMGMVVDAVLKVVHIPTEDIEVSGTLMTDEGSLAQVAGIAKAEGKLITLIDLEEVLSLASTPRQGQRNP